jgi:hypothetical protein
MGASSKGKIEVNKHEGLNPLSQRPPDTQPIGEVFGPLTRAISLGPLLAEPAYTTPSNVSVFSVFYA